ncbi:mitochondrial single-stranded DNA-binding protein [Bombyx mori]|uniref:Mitochondrial single-stranded DNA-binding protein n=1 Tax=Bombyx mori TaxID=7091 RepID=Q1HQ48_BOMMO|nr:mitochondrial single-stranded DNA-binding protein [Bombyx mori]ABF51293.1 mitochondrial single-stranded DNA-binding protein [Bombyx mori]
MLSSIRTPTLIRVFFGGQRLHTSVARLEGQKNEKTINQVTLLGRVGADPQKRGSEEHPVINFPLATHYSYKYESGDILQRTDWHRVSIFKPGLRDTVYKYLKKGQRIYVTGKLSYGEVKLDDGQVRTASTVMADDVIFFQSTPYESEQ